ncbi:hypothetical protein K438DRAFT_1752559 [Mycena galopus ATCC 62051]|nr:hypothetical protein K438DRAFT_1752559 [Mycena galopus ATCC 62051]
MFLTRRLWWPVYIVVGQGLLLSLAWGFFAVVRARGQIPMSLAVADAMRSNPQSKTYVVTFLATSLSALSSYLFSQAVRHAILVYLTGPLSVSTLGFGILISRRTPFFRRQAVLWVLAGGVFFLATLGQTASWTALLTPNIIVTPTPLEGTEIDLTSDVFNDIESTQFLKLWNGTMGTALQAYMEQGPGITSVLEMSGTANAYWDANQVSVVNFGGWDYADSTGGIAPIDLRDTVPLNSGELFTTNVKPYPPPGTDFNTSMIQQGLTANVSCQYQQLDETTNPPLRRVIYPVLIEKDTFDGFSYTGIIVSTICSDGEIQSTSVVSSTNETLVSLICGTTDDTGTTTYTVIIDGNGIYAAGDESVVCTVTPLTLDYVVTYSGKFIYRDFDSEPVNRQSTPAPPGIGAIATYCLADVFIYGQSSMRNVVGDSITSISDSQSGLSVTTLWVPSVLFGWEAYIQGVVEFVGTAVKTDLAWVNGPLGGSLPPTMIRTISGTALTTSLGWEYKEAIGPAILIPSTFIAVASILIVVFAQLKNRKIQMQHADFDPNDPLLLMAAASAGG